MAKLFFLKAAKPLAVLAVGAYGAYGLYEWNRAQQALELKGKNMKELSDIFDKIDSNKNGSIDLNELDRALNTSNFRFSKSQLRAMMKKADVDHDGQISREEFINICEELQTSTHVPSVTTAAAATHFEDLLKKNQKDR